MLRIKNLRSGKIKKSEKVKKENNFNVLYVNKRRTEKIKFHFAWW